MYQEKKPNEKLDSHIKNYIEYVEYYISQTGKKPDYIAYSPKGIRKTIESESKIFLPSRLYDKEASCIIEAIKIVAKKYKLIQEIDDRLKIISKPSNVQVGVYKYKSERKH
jgi:hypothetical protein